MASLWLRRQVSRLLIGSELRSFASAELLPQVMCRPRLHLGRLDPTVDFVVGVTRCSKFAGSKRTMQQYVGLL